MSARYETFLRIKSAETPDGERWLTAWATTPDEDLAGDVVLPAGAQYTMPVPLLAYHRTDQPVGVVTEAHISERGIRVRARLSRGVALADECWQLVRDGAIGAVSIGFRAIKASPLPSGGMLFEAWRWLELSLTPVPCNQNARITSVGKALAYAAAPQEPAALPAPRARKAHRQTAPEVVTPADMIEVCKGIGELVKEALAPLKDRIAALEADAEHKGIRFCGFWQKSATARRNDAFTHDGSMWIALRDTDENPAANSPDWILAARKGRDAR